MTPTKQKENLNDILNRLSLENTPNTKPFFDPQSSPMLSNFQKITDDNSILKMTINLAPESADPINFEKGSNAIFHYKAFAYVIPELHDHSKDCCDHHVHSTNETKLEERNPVRVKIADTRDVKSSKPFEMRIGMGFSVKAMELGIKSMKIGEKARFLCDPEQAQPYYHLETVLRKERDAANGIVRPGRAGGCCGHAMMAAVASPEKDDLQRALEGMSPVELEFELLQVQPPNTFQKEVWEMTAEEKWKEAPKRKTEGGELYSKQQYEKAAEKYARALVLLESLSMSSQTVDMQREEQELKRKEEQKRRNQWFDAKRGKTKADIFQSKVTSDVEGSETHEFNLESEDSTVKSLYTIEELETLMNQTRLNYAACKLKLSDFVTVIIQCSEVLKHNQNTLKALFRRGQAYLRLGRDLDLAEKDFLRCKEILIEKASAEANGESEKIPSIVQKMPEMIELRKELHILKDKQSQHQMKEQKMFGGIFQ
ncbi:hypothetical protein HK098_004859 [Nowakowskiella sp. JEL0407]|nr:hypothetical protein HK098_004855 [Nowakowskiella sp. JEL0407]KAJ3128284.1 hypothetical protein HK098_004859 [Nowakowskiella sp. JEL0407]